MYEALLAQSKHWNPGTPGEKQPQQHGVTLWVTERRAPRAQACWQGQTSAPPSDETGGSCELPPWDESWIWLGVDSLPGMNLEAAVVGAPYPGINLEVAVVPELPPWDEPGGSCGVAPSLG